MYTCTSMYLNTHTSFMQGHSSTPLPFTTITSLTTHCVMFIELFLLEHLRCFFVTDDRQRRVFCRERRPWQSCKAGGGRTSHAFTSISVSKGSFRWRLAWRVTDVCESTQHECENFPNWWLKTIIVLRIAACEGEHPDGSSVPSKGSKGHPSVPVQLRLRPSTFAVATDTTTGEPFNFFLPKSKSSSSRSSVLTNFWARVDRSSRRRPARRDSWRPAHYNVCTYFGMPIKLFLIRIWPRPPPPFSSGIRI